MAFTECADCGVKKTGKQQHRPRCRSCGNKGRTHMNGRTLTPETKDKLRVLAIRNKLGVANLDKKHSLEHRQNNSLGHGGDGDILNRRYPGLSRWTASVKKTFLCCVICRSTDGLEAHHIAPKALYPELATFALNGLTLCYECHRGTNGVHR